LKTVAVQGETAPSGCDAAENVSELLLLAPERIHLSMTFTVEDAFSEAVERLTTQAAAVLATAMVLFGLLQTAAGQDIYEGVVERILDALADAEFRSELGPEELDALETVETELEASISELPLALGLDPGLAVVVWLVAWVLGLVVTVIALDAFGNGRDTLSGIDTGNVGWHVLNLFLGTVVFGILFLVGLVLFVLPGLILFVFLLFFPAAIVLDDESFFGAFSSSATVVKENVLATLGVILVSIAVFIALGIAGTVVSGLLPAVPATVATELFSAVATLFGLALIARAYATATR
jgi:hypothetical protein